MEYNADRQGKLQFPHSDTGCPTDFGGVPCRLTLKRSYLFRCSNRRHVFLNTYSVLLHMVTEKTSFRLNTFICCQMGKFSVYSQLGSSHTVNCLIEAHLKYRPILNRSAKKREFTEFLLHKIFCVLNRSASSI